MKKILGISGIVIVLMIVIGVFVFFKPDGKADLFTFDRETAFLKKDYNEENYPIVREINVNKVRYEKLIVLIQAELEEGKLSYEVMDPSGQVRISDSFSEGDYEKLEEFEPKRGFWKVIIQVDEHDQGRIRVAFFDDAQKDELHYREPEDKSNMQDRPEDK